MTEIERSEKRLKRVLEFQFKTTGVTVDDKLRTYVSRKLRELLKKVPRPERDAAQFSVQLNQKRPAAGPDSLCKITLRLSYDVLEVTGSTAHHYAAVDIAADNLRQSLVDYRRTHYPRHYRMKP